MPRRSIRRERRAKQAFLTLKKNKRMSKVWRKTCDSFEIFGLRGIPHFARASDKPGTVTTQGELIEGVPLALGHGLALQQVPEPGQRRRGANYFASERR